MFEFVKWMFSLGFWPGYPVLMSTVFALIIGVFLAFRYFPRAAAWVAGTGLAGIVLLAWLEALSR